MKHCPSCGHNRKNEHYGPSKKFCNFCEVKVRKYDTETKDEAIAKDAKFINSLWPCNGKFEQNRAI